MREFKLKIIRILSPLMAYNEATVGYSVNNIAQV